MLEWETDNTHSYGTMFHELNCYIPVCQIIVRLQLPCKITIGWDSPQLGGFHTFLPSSARIIVIIRARRKRRWYNLNYTSHSPVEMYGILTVDYRTIYASIFFTFNKVNNNITRLFLR